MLKKLLVAFFVVIGMSLSAQTAMNGKIYDEYLEPFPGALIVSGDQKVSSDIDGNFILKGIKDYPFLLKVSALGYQSEEIEVLNGDQELNIILKENTTLDEVVVSASRAPEKVLESPVTIERLGLKDIKRTAAVSFYDALKNLKGVESRESSYGFKSVNSRGFSTFDNTRFVQLVDGVDSSIPALNFSAGNVVGLSELDVKNVEILPGASSALYGANAFNGILLMTSKNPFDYDGISTYVKGGFTSQEAAGNNNFYDVGLRMAYKFDEKFAAKVNFAYFEAEEWHANSIANTTGVGGFLKEGTRESHTDYDGLNVYGDEFSLTLRQIAALGGASPAQIAAIPDGDARISRTGIAESALTDYDSYNLKFDGSLHYRPWGSEDFEIIFNSRFSRGSNIYQGTNRFSQKDFFIQQHRLEFTGKNFFVRGYYSENDTGDSHDLRFAAVAVNEASKPSSLWFGEYLAAFTGQLTSLGVAPLNHQAARNFADRDALNPNSSAFRSALQESIDTQLNVGGAGIKDRSSFYHADANYNFKDIINFGEIQLGGSYRKYNVNSNGSIFTDADEPIVFDMYGAYVQLQKKFFDERLKFTGSLRYDKLQSFKGNISPRLALNYFAGENKNHILRASYQTGFRNPSTIEQFFGLATGPGSYLIGTAEENLDRFAVSTNNNNPFIPTSIVTGRDAFERGLSTDGTFAQISLDPIKQEKVTSYELGYRGLVDISDNNILEIDVNGYYNRYDDFVAYKDVFVTNYGGVANGFPDALAQQAIAARDITLITVNTNTDAVVNSYGGTIGLKTKVFKKFNLGANYTLTKLDFDQSEDPTFEPSFNSPEHQVKVAFGNPNLFKNLGFNINYRWQNEFYWQSSFLEGNIDARSVIDAQISYAIPSIKSRFKLGGTNLTGQEYQVALGSGSVGSLYYISWTIND